MQRVSRKDVRVVGMEALLRGEDASIHADAVESVPQPDAAAILAAERDTVLREAQEQGYAQGIARADAEIADAVARAEAAVGQQHARELDRLQRANTRVARLLEQVPEAIRDAEARMEETALEIAYVSVLRLLDVAHADRALLSSLCRKALAEFAARPVTLHVAAQDVDDMDGVVAGSGVVVEADADLPSGQLRLVTHKGMYETSLELRLEQLKQAFLHAIADAGSPSS